MDLRQLEYFVHVANTLNITKAAMRAHISQPALSRQIRLLEDELGASLFQRKARGVMLTETGQRLLDRTKVLLENVGRMKSDIQSAADEPIGTIRLAASNSLSTLLTSRVVARYRHTYPKVSVHINENTSLKVRDTLVQEGADIALLSDRESFTGIITIPLAAESLMLIAPPEVGLSISRPVSAKALTGHNLILTPFPNGLRRAVDEILFRAGKVPAPKVEVDTNGLMINLTKQGVGYCVLPYSGVHDLLVRGEVSAAPIRSAQWRWVIAVSREKAMSTATKKMIEMIKYECKVLIDTGYWQTASQTI